MFCFFYIFGPKTGPGGPGRCLKSFLEAVRFILTEYGTVGSHGDPIHDYFNIFWARMLCPRLPKHLYFFFAPARAGSGPSRARAEIPANPLKNNNILLNIQKKPSGKWGTGDNHPPKKRIVVIALIKTIFAYSPKKKNANGKEEYST